MSVEARAHHENCYVCPDVSDFYPSPCGGTYLCGECGRFVGWCFGCHDDQPDVCDDCYVVADSEATA